MRCHQCGKVVRGLWKRKFCSKKCCQSFHNFLYRTSEYGKKNKTTWYWKNRDRILKVKRKLYYNHPEGVLKWRLSKYSLSIKDYQIMLDRQGGVCSICGRNEMGAKKRLSVDHNKRTGAVRGLLCGKCNSVLGFVDDSIERLQNAIKYLESHK